MKIYLGSDHAGFELKQALGRYLQEAGHDVLDLGNTELDPDDDYPDYAFDVGEAVAKEPEAFGVLVCGSAQGVCMAANKVKGVRAAPIASEDEAKKTREHNDANVLCLSGWNQSIVEAGKIVATFLSTPFSDEERHARRLGKIRDYESR